MTEVEPMVDVTEVAEFLKVRPRNIYERVARGAIPYYRLGRYLRFRISEVEASLEKNDCQ